LLLGNFDYEFVQQRVLNNAIRGTFRENSTAVLTPAFGSRLAFGIKRRLGEGVYLDGVIGYDFQVYVGGARRIAFVDDVNGASIARQKDNLFLHGPFLRLTFRFDNWGNLIGIFR
jgi:hypothetical protein